jgi:broad specificity phosphatase PhoE
LTNANLDIFIREQDKGVLEGQSATGRQDKFEDELKRREREQIYWAPLGGESIATCAQRYYIII